MRKLLLTSSCVLTLVATAACNPAANTTATETGETQIETDGGVIEAPADAVTEAPEPVEGDSTEVADEGTEPEDATSAN